MKFNLTWTQKKTVEIDAVDMAAAEEYGVKMIGRLGGFQSGRTCGATNAVSMPRSTSPEKG